MKVLYIITKSGAGGAQTHIYQLSKHLAENSHAVGVMCQPGGWLEDSLSGNGNEARDKEREAATATKPDSEASNVTAKPNGHRNRRMLNEVNFYPNSHLRNSFNPIHGIKAMREIRRVISELNPDVVSLHSSAAGFWARLTLRGKVPTIFTAHSWGFMPGVPFLRRWIVFVAEKLVARYTHKIICVSENDRQLALKYKIAPPDKLTTIHNGVEITDYVLRITDYEKIKIIFVGRLGKQKYPELLLEAYRQIADSREQRTVNREQGTGNREQGAENKEQTTSKVRLQIVGDGPKRANLEKYVKENNLSEYVEFKGDLSREDVLEELAQSDIFVLTSHYEGFPRSIIEAMAQGLPVIVSDVGGSAEALRPLNIAEETRLPAADRELRGDENGIVLKENSTGELKTALKILIEDKSLREEMGKNSRKRAEEEFSLEKMIRETMEVYRKMVV